MALPLIPLLLAKVAGKFAVKKVAAHLGHHGARHAARQTLGNKVVQNAVQKVADRAIDKALHRKDQKEVDGSSEARPSSEQTEALVTASAVAPSHNNKDG